jgi:radical SAM protein with 4Fe4S-binding SPASM domain
MAGSELSLAIELTAHCNQKCGYCYNGWREDNGKSVGSLRPAELVALVERALTEVDFHHVTLTGGEPFSYPGLIEVLEVVRRHGKRAKIISNGGMITPALAAAVAPFRPYFVQVTLNGPDRALHEEHVGPGHFDRTLRGIEALKSAGVPVTGCVVVTRKNARRLGETLDLWRSLGVETIALSRFSPAGYAAQQIAELLPSRSELIEAFAQAEARGRDHGLGLQVTMPVPQCVVAHEDFPHLRFGTCPIGTGMQELALGPRGELRNCTLHAESIGDARTERFDVLLASPAVTAYRDVTPEFCAPCPHRKSCAGGCGAAAGWVLGDPRGLDPLVAQHVDEELSARLKQARRGLIPAASLVR